MPKSRGKKFYAVANGRKVGIFQTWDECKAQVDGFRNSRYKGFKSRPEALAFLNQFQGSSVATAPLPPSVGSKSSDNRKRKEIEEDSGPVNPKKSRAAASTTSTSASNLYIGPIHASGGTAPGLIFHIHFDGGARGNPGVAGAGAEVILSRSNVDSSSTTRASNTFMASKMERIQQSQSKTVIRRLCKTLIRDYLGDTFTNNQAEYKGLIVGLQKVLDTLQTKKYPLITDNSNGDNNERVSLIVQGDSKLIIQQVRGAFECKSPKLQAYHRSAKGLLQSIQKECHQQTGQPCLLTLEHVYRENNKVADCLANNAMDAKRSWTSVYEEDDENEANANNETDAKENENSVPVESRWV